LSAKREKSKSLKNIEERENTLMTTFQPLKKLTLVSMCSSLREEFNKSIVALKVLLPLTMLEKIDRGP
jgi:hypothetical protein